MIVYVLSESEQLNARKGTERMISISALMYVTELPNESRFTVCHISQVETKCHPALNFCLDSRSKLSFHWLNLSLLFYIQSIFCSLSRVFFFFFWKFSTPELIISWARTMFSLKKENTRAMYLTLTGGTNSKF